MNAIFFLYNKYLEFVWSPTFTGRSIRLYFQVFGNPVVFKTDFSFIVFGFPCDGRQKL